MSLLSRRNTFAIRAAGTSKLPVWIMAQPQSKKPSWRLGSLGCIKLGNLAWLCHGQIVKQVFLLGRC